MSEPTAPAPSALTELPLFPLGTVLFPGALLPLQIFELRYLQMVGECERQGTGFGVVTLTQGREVHRPGQADEAFEAIGTRVQIERIERPQAGLVLVWCRGIEQFQIHSTQQRPDGLWRGKVQAWPAQAAVPVPDHLQYLAQQIQSALLTLSAQDNSVALWTQPWALDNCAWVANRWCELLPLPLAMKYRLFSLNQPLMRLELVGDMVEMAPPAQSGGTGAQNPGTNS